MKHKATDGYSVVLMEQYGVNMAVLTPHNSLEKTRANFEKSDDTKWCGGKGKAYLYAWLKVQLLKEDAYFTKHPRKAKPSNDKWTDFCNDCVSFAALSSVLYQTPIHLIHPSIYEQSLKHAPVKATSGVMPTLFSNIPVLN
jgi:hypothetical protein